LRVFITGLGVVSSIGLGKDAFFASLAAGTSGISNVESFDASNLGRDLAGEVKAFRARDHLTAAEVRRMGGGSRRALGGRRMAIADAGLKDDALKGPRASVVLGTTMGEADVLEDLDAAWIQKGLSAVKRAMIPKYGSTLLPIHVARAIGAEGAVLTLPAACAAGNYAIGFACDMIRAGKADVVVTGAAEMLQSLQFSGRRIRGRQNPTTSGMETSADISRVISRCERFARMFASSNSGSDFGDVGRADRTRARAFHVERSIHARCSNSPRAHTPRMRPGQDRSRGRRPAEFAARGETVCTGVCLAPDCCGVVRAFPANCGVEAAACCGS